MHSFWITLFQRNILNPSNKTKRVANEAWLTIHDNSLILLPFFPEAIQNDPRCFQYHHRFYAYISSVWVICERMNVFIKKRTIHLHNYRQYRCVCVVFNPFSVGQFQTFKQKVVTFEKKYFFSELFESIQQNKKSRRKRTNVFLAKPRTN